MQPAPPACAYSLMALGAHIIANCRGPGHSNAAAMLTSYPNVMSAAAGRTAVAFATTDLLQPCRQLNFQKYLLPCSARPPPPRGHISRQQGLHTTTQLCNNSITRPTHRYNFNNEPTTCPGSLAPQQLSPLAPRANWHRVHTGQPGHRLCRPNTTSTAASMANLCLE